jgi:hypothetical protein
MHVDGGLLWAEAERLALADVLRQGDAPEPLKAIEPTAPVQARLFAFEEGPYR